MNSDERNKWLVENYEWFKEKATRMYCSKGLCMHIELDDYLQTLLLKLIDWFKWQKGDIDRYQVQWRMNASTNYILKSIIAKKEHEKELTKEVQELYLPNLTDGYWISLVEDAKTLDNKEKYVFIEKVFKDASLNDLAKDFKTNKESIRVIYNRACRKVCKELFTGENTKFSIEYHGPIELSTDTDGGRRTDVIMFNSSCWAGTLREAHKIFRENIINFFDVADRNPNVHFHQHLTKFKNPIEILW